MNEKYQLEIDNFIRRFGEYRASRIVLYGIGRYTATLLEGLKGFRIVGLMDKDPSNTGKTLSGVPILDKETAEETADMVIINTAETYWSVIYNRIRDMRIPVYYINGVLAEPETEKEAENPFGNLSRSEMLAETEKAEVVSFDFFDTLFMRSVCSPRDVFQIMEIREGIPFVRMRDRAKKHVRENYSLDELYGRMETLEEMPCGRMGAVKEKELELEKRLLVPRSGLLSLLKDLLKRNREVYIISDMYLPKDFYTDVLKEYGIEVPDKAILLSNELDADKSDGTLWRHYAENIVRGRTALHIGDNMKADVEIPKAYGIAAYHTPNVWEMLLRSSLKDIAPHICGIYDTSVMGCVLDRLFENPFALNHAGAAVNIRNNHDMGYCVFGPVILTFLLWLDRQSKADGVRKLVFMARDGYFLKEDFAYLCGLTGEQRECCYVGISRQLAMAASTETKRDLTEYASMPYTGGMAELFEDRFGIRGVRERENKRMDDYINEYLPEIEKNLAEVRNNYMDYIKGFELGDDCAVVDIGYYGNNQKYLNKLLQTGMRGYYMNANLSVENGNAAGQKMTACFQKDGDATGERSRILKKQIYLESFLTAPYGMVKAVDGNGNFLCAPNGKNQEHFRDKEEMNEGVKRFIADYMERFGDLKTEPDREFADEYYGCCFGGALEFAEEVKRSFYNDNAMMNRIESGLFY